MHATLLIAMFALVAPPSKEAPKEDSPSIVGQWKLVDITAAGRSLGPDDRLPKVVFEFTDHGKYRVRVNGKSDPEATYSADPSKDPAAVDFGGDTDGKKQQAIYKIEKDTLTLCWNEDGGSRPAKFEAAVGTAPCCRRSSAYRRNENANQH